MAASLVVREISEFSGWLAAEMFGVPHVALQVSAWRPELIASAAKHLARHRQRVGLPPDTKRNSFFRYALLSPEPPAYRVSGRSYPATTFPVRLSSFDGKNDAESIELVPASGTRPRIYATLGTAYNLHPALFEHILEAVSGLDVEVVMTTGVSPADVGLPLQIGNVMIRSYLPVSELLPSCSAVISHAGFGTLQAALRHGLPQVLMPIAVDQPDNARQCEAHGVAIVIESADRTAEAIRVAVQAILEGVEFRTRAHSWKKAIAALPGPAEAIGMLSELAANSVGSE